MLTLDLVKKPSFKSRSIDRMKVSMGDESDDSLLDGLLSDDDDGDDDVGPPPPAVAAPTFNPPQSAAAVPSAPGRRSSQQPAPVNRPPKASSRQQEPTAADAPKPTPPVEPPAPKLSKRVVCQWCEEDDATDHCNECNQNYCSDCSRVLHRKPSQREHSFGVIVRPKLYNDYEAEIALSRRVLSKEVIELQLGNGRTKLRVDELLPKIRAAELPPNYFVMGVVVTCKEPRMGEQAGPTSHTHNEGSHHTHRCCVSSHHCCNPATHRCCGYHCCNPTAAAANFFWTFRASELHAFRACKETAELHIYRIHAD